MQSNSISKSSSITPDELDLASIIDVPALQSLMEKFYAITHMGIGIIDLRGNVLVKVGWQDACTRFHRLNPESVKNCRESDIILSEGVKPGEFREYKCKNHIWDIVTPIFISGRHVGNLFFGQYFYDDETIDYDCFAAQAEKFGFNKEEYLAAIKSTQRFSREEVRNLMIFFSELAQMISQLSYSNLKMTKAISDQEQVEQSLQESQEDLKHAQEVSHTGNWRIDLKKNVLLWSEETYRIFGIAAKTPMTYEKFLSCVYPEDREYVDQKWAEALRGGDYDIEHRILANNEVKWVREKAELEFDPQGKLKSGFGTIQDVTERKKSEQERERLVAELQHRTAESRAVFSSVIVGIGIYDLNARLISLNPAGQRILGYIQDDLNKPVSVRMAKVSPRMPDGRLITPEETIPVRALKGESVRDFIFTLHRANEEVRWILGQGSPIKAENGDIIGAVLVITDITEHKQAEEDLKRYTRNLEEAIEELESFSYSVSHDLRQPLRAMDGFSAAVIEEYGDKLDEQGKDYLNRVRQASQLMSQLIDDILKLSKVTRAEMEWQNIDLSEMVRSIASELHAAQPERKVEFVISPDITVHGDKRLFEILLRNLLENSWKFTGKFSQPKIQFGVSNLNGNRACFVRDNGAGFDMSYADKLFKPFQRLHRETDFPGTGIGLATAQRIIHRHGGKIWAESKPGQGTTIYFTCDPGVEI